MTTNHQKCIPSINKLAITYIDSLHDFIAEEPRGVKTETDQFRANIAKMLKSNTKELKTDPDMWLNLFSKLYDDTNAYNALEQYIEYTKKSNFDDIIKTYQEGLKDGAITTTQCHLIKLGSPIREINKVHTRSIYGQLFDRLKQFMFWNTLVKNQLNDNKKISLNPIKRKDYASTISSIENYHQTLNQGDSLLTVAGVVLGKSMICNTSAQYLDPSGANYKEKPLLIRIDKKSKNSKNKGYSKYEQISLNHPSDIEFVINTYVFHEKLVQEIEKSADNIFMIDSIITKKHILHELHIKDRKKRIEYYIHVFEKEFDYDNPFQTRKKNEQKIYSTFNDLWKQERDNKIVINENKRAGMSITDLCKFYNNHQTKSFVLIKIIFAIKNCGDLLQFKLSQEINKLASGNKYGKIYVHTKDILAASCSIAFDSPVVFHSSGSIIFINEIDETYKQYNEQLKKFTNLELQRIEDIYKYLNDPVKRLIILQNPKSGLQLFIQNLSKYNIDLQKSNNSNSNNKNNNNNRKKLLTNFFEEFKTTMPPKRAFQEAYYQISNR